MKYTLLQLTQDVLSSMDSDEINSINDTVESQQVVKILKTVYDDIISRGDIGTNRTLFNLTASGSGSKPTLMTKPDTIDKIVWIKYNNILDGGADPVWDDIVFLSLDEFVHRNHQLNPSESNVDTMSITQDGFTFVFNYRNDIGPTYYTTFDDATLIFDAVNTDVDSTLQSSKTMGYGTLITSWTEADTFVPELQPQQFALLLNEAKSLAWAELKQTPHNKAEMTARKNWSHLQKTREQVPDGTFGSGNHPFEKLPSFGRAGRGSVIIKLH